MLRYLIRRNASYFNLTNETIQDNYTDAAEFNISNYNTTFDNDDEIKSWVDWFASWFWY